ncbi:MAG TPA: hypothetical protein VFF79_05600 [Conexibacter sp.]|jgi:hypothetical protein|nr:hypothetical protein [Conexibacter sp.]
MTLTFWLSDACLVAVQSASLALPRGHAPARAQKLARRLSGRGWALVPLASIVLVVAAIRAAGATADGLTWLALIAVPPLAAAALGATMRGGRPPLALLAVPLFALAWARRGTLAGEGAAVLLSALSCVTLGVLLTAVAPRGWLKAGIVLMAIVDAILVGSELLQPANDVLNAAAPPAHLPQLQRALFGDAVMGYGDLFVAGVFGAIVAAEQRVGGPDDRPWRWALVVLALALAFDLLFLVVDMLPATVPVAMALLVREWVHRRRRESALARGAPARETR